MCDFLFYLAASSRLKRCTFSLASFNLDQLPPDPLNSEVKCQFFVSLTFVGARARHLFRGISKALFSRAKCLDCSGPRLATGHEVGVVAVVFLGAGQVFYAENVIWSPCKECSRVDPVLLDSPAIDILD